MNDLFTLTDRTVVVIGAGGLIGRRFAGAIVRAGGSAVLADRDAEALNSLSASLENEIAAAGDASSAVKRIFCQAVDITDRDSLDALLQATLKYSGRVDGLVNCAYPRNQNYGREFMQVTYDDFCENTGLHLGGYFLACQRFLKYFVETGRGSIVNISSIYGSVAPRFEVYAGTPMTMPVEYAAIKAGLQHLTKYMARYVRGAEVRVNCLSPGGIEAGQPESFLAAYKAFCNSRGMLDADDLIGALLFLLSDASRFVTGQNIVVDDGFTL